MRHREHSLPQYVSLGLVYLPSHCLYTESVGRDWEYFTFSAHVKPHLIPEDDGSVELIMLARNNSSIDQGLYSYLVYSLIKLTNRVSSIHS